MFSHRSKNVLVKIENFNPHMDAGLAKFSPFRRELIFYRDILPKIKGLHVSERSSDNDEICAKSGSIPLQMTSNFFCV